jgi:tubulin polyglutamylase TTLL6/13
MHLKRF